ncbi:PLDc N-terminal domain-containing protein [Algoriphagus sp. A40]|uniref:PLDc N-terminal domain-containing protein n=1 Tax=Algoriphagus sp. A40 TaxID=1945863 RepID=UPI000985A77E|nr:hypothetical protein B0E43_18985 [Algoriphagus sp. A40]
MTPNSGFVIWQLSGLVLLGFWVYALFDCVKSDFYGQNQKLIWMMPVLFAPVIGTFLYISMSKGSKKERNFQPIFNRDNSHKS